MYLFSILLIIVSNIAYHTLSKGLPKEVNPALSFAITSGVASLTGFTAFFISNGNGSIPAAFGKVNWISPVLGFVVAGLDIGFILAYRAGWILSAATATSLIVTTLALVPVGILLYREELSWAQMVGIVLCVAGVILLQIGKTS